MLKAVVTGIGFAACVAMEGIGGLFIVLVGSGLSLFSGIETDESVDVMYLAQSGDFSTSGYNPREKVVRSFNLKLTKEK